MSEQSAETEVLVIGFNVEITPDEATVLKDRFKERLPDVEVVLVTNVSSMVTVRTKSVPAHQEGVKQG